MLIWDYLEEGLMKFGFPSKFVNWIMGFVKGPKFSVLVNGFPTGWFASTKGLRQGDPLAPCLFIIATEELIRRVKSAAEEGVLRGIRLCPRGN